MTPTLAKTDILSNSNKYKLGSSALQARKRKQNVKRNSGMISNGPLSEKDSSDEVSEK
jgi:hypothetical protein